MSTVHKKISPAATIALKDALTHIYWTKKDLRAFVNYTIKNTTILGTLDWQNNVKYEIVSQMIDRMIARPDIYEDDLMSLFNEVMNFSDFSHLKQWEDGDQKIKIAQEKVEALRSHTKVYFDIVEEKEKTTARQAKVQLKQSESLAYRQKLEDFHSRFTRIAISTNPQRKGYDLEILLNEVFIFFDLDPKASFKIVGEQIDGAFTFDNNDYLLEAKWQQALIDAGELYKFAGKISGKLKNTLGLFISINGFSKECTEVKSEALKAMVLMNGEDLSVVLEGRIALGDLLYRKRRYASETGNIYLKAKDILG